MWLALLFGPSLPLASPLASSPSSTFWLFWLLLFGCSQFDAYCSSVPSSLGGLLGGLRSFHSRLDMLLLLLWVASALLGSFCTEPLHLLAPSRSVWSGRSTRLAPRCGWDKCAELNRHLHGAPHRWDRGGDPDPAWLAPLRVGGLITSHLAPALSSGAHVDSDQHFLADYFLGVLLLGHPSGVA